MVTRRKPAWYALRRRRLYPPGYFHFSPPCARQLGSSPYDGDTLRGQYVLIVYTSRLRVQVNRWPPPPRIAFLFAVLLSCAGCKAGYTDVGPNVGDGRRRRRCSVSWTRMRLTRRPFQHNVCGESGGRWNHAKGSSVGRNFHNHHDSPLQFPWTLSRCESYHHRG